MLTGILGISKSGKDTAAQFLVTDFKLVGMAFADEMKRICKRLYGFTDEQLWGPSEMRNAPDTRYPREHTWKVIRDEWGDETGWECACCGSERPVGKPPSIAQCHLTPRYALQRLGGEWGRDCYTNTWVDITIRDAGKLLNDPSEPAGWFYRPQLGLLSNHVYNKIPEFVGGVIITDVRHLNEIQAIQQAGGTVIRVIRQEAGLKGAVGQHQSETEQLSIPDSAFDAVVKNNDTLEALQGKMHDVAKTVLGL